MLILNATVNNGFSWFGIRINNKSPCGFLVLGNAWSIPRWPSFFFYKKQRAFQDTSICAHIKSHDEVVHKSGCHCLSDHWSSKTLPIKKGTSCLLVLNHCRTMVLTNISFVLTRQNRPLSIDHMFGSWDDPQRRTIQKWWFPWVSLLILAINLDDLGWLAGITMEKTSCFVVADSGPWLHLFRTRHLGVTSRLLHLWGIQLVDIEH